MDRNKYKFFAHGKDNGGQTKVLEVCFSMLDQTKEIMLCTCRDVSRISEQLVAKSGKTFISIKLEDIFYLESYGRKTLVSVKNDINELNEMLSSLQKRLPGQDFMRCHRCYIVRLDTIKKIEKTEAVLDNGQSIPVSRTQLPLLRDIFISLSKNFYTN